MAGYIGSKAVLLSTTAATVTGAADIGGNLTVDTNTLYVDATNNRVGIGTSSPEKAIHVKTAVNNTAFIRIESTATDSYPTLSLKNDAREYQLTAHGPLGDKFTIYDGTAGSHRLVIDSSGNLLVGQTTSVAPASDNVNGIALAPSGYISASRSSIAAEFNRSGVDGDIVVFRKSGTTVGSIGVNSGDQTYFSRVTGSQGIKFKNSGTVPCNSDGTDSDNDQDLGQLTIRWDDVYATNGTIQTSDRNEKQDIAELDEAEKRVAVAAKGLIRKYRWKDAVAEKGDDARIHVGIIAQDLQAAFEAEGLDAGRYAMFISSTWWEHEGQTYETAEEAPEGATERTRLGVRYPELLAFIIGAM